MRILPSGMVQVFLPNKKTYSVPMTQDEGAALESRLLFSQRTIEQHKASLEKLEQEAIQEAESE